MPEMVALRTIYRGGGRKPTKDERFSCSESDAVHYESLGLAERYHASKMKPAHENKMVEPKSNKAWPLKMTPDEYLDRYPDGPNAALARSVLGK